MGKSKKAAANEEFDTFLQDLQKATKETGKQKAKDAKKKHPTKADVVAKNNAKTSEEKTTRVNEFEAVLKRQQQQRLIQQMLSQIQMGGMGGFGSPFLNAPKTDIESFTKTAAGFVVGSAGMQGWRKEMEDAEVVDMDLEDDGKTGLFAVFDGHAGSKCSTGTAKVFPMLARQHYKKDSGVDFTKMYSDLDNSLKAKLSDDSGCTAVSVFINDKTIVCANVGDSRAVLCRDGKCISLSEDHKPENAEEKARIIAAGGHVADNRTNGQLAMSRAIGDFSYKKNADLPADKQLVISVPEIMTETRDAAKDEFLVVACDGIFDVMTNEEVVEFTHAGFQDNKTPEEIARALTEKCLAPVDEQGRPARPLGTDNMTATVIKLI